MRNKLTFKDSEGNIVLDVGLGIVAFSAIEKIKKAVLDIKEKAGYEEIVSVFKTLSDDKANKLKFDDFGKGKSSLTEERESAGPLDESDIPISAQVDDIKTLVEFIEDKDFGISEESGNDKEASIKDEKPKIDDKNDKKKPFSAMNDAMQNVIKMDGSSFKPRSQKEDEEESDKKKEISEDKDKDESEDDEDDDASAKTGKVKDKVDEEEDKKET